jgi:hypothetical protein
MHKINQEVEEIEEPRIKRIFVIIIALFLIFLMLSFAVVTFPVDDIIVSLTSSAKIQDGLVQQDIEIQFNTNTYDELLEIYNDQQAHEFKVCLLGEIQEEVYHIDQIIIPITFSQTFNQVVSEPCPQETLIALHSHPFNHCIASEQDLNNLEEAKKVNPDAVIGIMCAPERFNFYN